jgi:hypothetical protein
MNSTQVCTRCGVDKSDENTTRKKSGKFQAYCQPCTKIVNAANYQKNRLAIHDKNKRKQPVSKHCGKGEPEVVFYRRKDTLKGTPRFICNTCGLRISKALP